MAAVSVLAIILLLQSCFGTSNSAPLFENVCQESDLCGKGNCLASNNSAFGYKCECDSGWKQSGDTGDESLKFLPCVIPNCSWNNSCVNASAPAPNNDKPTSSFLDPCFWTDCGPGKCVKTSVFRSTCLCEDGFYNLFNATNFPCYKQCAFGVDCTSLGINLGNGSTSSSTAIPSTSYGISLIRRAGVVSLSSVMTILAVVVCHCIQTYSYGVNFEF
ncbi:uncharacterized protein LOC142527381 [Primulina tabacum]|uniref:uncharacterized protein LOC142527381 n=1 Tax=Primulina tabacum TaxID=48773 RepID=UPI003F5ACB8E